jgi:hypothetical protein
MKPVNDLMLNFVSPCGSYMLTFEDDGKVAYAYMKKETRLLEMYGCIIDAKLLMSLNGRIVTNSLSRIAKVT